MTMPGEVSVEAVRIAFDRFRSAYGPARPPRFLRYPSDTDAMTAADGLEQLVDGPGDPPAQAAMLQAMSESTLPDKPRVWAVRPADVVHAPKHCAFGASRSAQEVKHSNLTGGEDAYSAGELIFMNAGTVIVNGDSGRYGPRSASEMQSVAIAFRDSGYVVYSMGFDEEANKPNRFVGGRPALV